MAMMAARVHNIRERREYPAVYTSTKHSSSSDCIIPPVARMVTNTSDTSARCISIQIRIALTICHLSKMETVNI